MSRENVELVRRWFEAGEARDYSAFPDLFHPDFVLDLSRNIFNPDTYRGVEGLRLFAERMDEMWEEMEAHPDEIIDAGDWAVVAVRMKGTGRDGVQGEMVVFSVYEFREGKITRITGGFRERDEALEAAGLQE